MNITHTIVLSFEAASNEELDAFNNYAAYTVQRVNEKTRYTAKLHEHCQLVGVLTTPDQMEFIRAELEACLDNTPEDFRHGTTEQERQALINMLADLKGN